MKRRSSKILCMILIFCVMLSGVCFAAATGDVDGDGKISAADARLTLRASVGLESYSPETNQFAAADTDGDGKITAADARMILRASVGLEILKQTAAEDKPSAESILYFLKSKLDFDEPGTNSKKRYVTIGFEGKTADIPLVREYVTMLAESGYALVDTYEMEYEEVFFSCALDYKAKKLIGRSEMNFTDGVEGDITLYYYTQRGRLYGQAIYSEEIALIDTGRRCGGKDTDISFAGGSANAGIYAKNGGFSTDDGRLFAVSGKANIICDGKKYTVNATVKTVPERKTVIFATDMFSGVNAMGAIIPELSLNAGETFANERLDSQEVYFSLLRDYPRTDMLDAMSCARWTLGFGVCHNGKYFCPCATIETGIEKAFIRVLYRSDTTVVLYAAAQFDTAPYSTEMLGVFDMTKALTAEKESGEGFDVPGINTGKEKCGYCGGDGRVKCFQCTNGKMDCHSCVNGWIYDLPTNRSYKCANCLDGKIDCPNCTGGEKKCPFCNGGWR